MQFKHGYTKWLVTIPKMFKNEYIIPFQALLCGIQSYSRENLQGA